METFNKRSDVRKKCGAGIECGSKLFKDHRRLKENKCQVLLNESN